MTRNGNTTCWPRNKNYARPRRASSFPSSPSLSLSLSLCLFVSPVTVDYSSESVRSASRTNSFSRPCKLLASVTRAFVRSQLSRYLTRINRNVLRLLEDSIDHPFQLVALATFSTSFYTFTRLPGFRCLSPSFSSFLSWFAWLTLARSHPPPSSSPVAPPRAT